MAGEPRMGSSSVRYVQRAFIGGAPGSAAASPLSGPPPWKAGQSVV
jgi:hypothetical protein